MSKFYIKTKTQNFMAKKKEDEQNTSGLPETTDTENSGSINPAEELAAAKADTSTAKRKKDGYYIWC
jgi:hypothetical protein